MDQPETTRERTQEGEAPKSLTDRAYAALEERIVTLALAPGSVLSESALAASLGIGRTPIREALQRLARESLVVIMPRRGVMVSEINVRDQLEALKVRRVLECLMAELAASRASPAERTRFAEIAASMRVAADQDDDVGFMRLDRELNLLIAQSCHNRYARRAMGLLQGLIRRFWYVHYKEVLDLPLCARLHADEASAIAEGDPEDARRATIALLDYTETFTRAALDSPY
ncbi:MAG: GntR family transcriptional regulator [Kiloniellales bacterium]